MEYPLNESAWGRGRRDTWAGWKNPLFGILDAVVCVVVGTVFGWYWGVGLFLFAMFCVWVVATARAPVKQRNEARKKVLELQGTLGQEGYIEAFIIDGVDLSNKLKQIMNLAYALCGQKELADFGEWYTAISTYLQKHMPGEYSSWYRSVFIGNDEPSVVEVIRAYESGLDILEDIRKKFSSSIAHRGGSQN